MAPSATETLSTRAAPSVEKEIGKVAYDVAAEHWKDFGLLPIPKHVRYNPERPFHFGLLMNVIFGIASTFSMSFVVPSFSINEARADSLPAVSNLYYCQPLLSKCVTFSLRFACREPCPGDRAMEHLSRLPGIVRLPF